MSLVLGFGELPGLSALCIFTLTGRDFDAGRCLGLLLLSGCATVTARYGGLPAAIHLAIDNLVGSSSTGGGLIQITDVSGKLSARGALSTSLLILPLSVAY